MTSFPMVCIVVGIIAAVAVCAGIILAVRAHQRTNRELSASKMAHHAAVESDASAPLDAPTVEYADVPSESTIQGSSLETPESVPNRMQRLRARLAKSGGLGHTLLSILSRSDLSPSDWEELEETLLIADVGMDATTELMETLKREVKVLGTSDPARVRHVLRAELLKLIDPSMDRSLNVGSAESAQSRRNAADSDISSASDSTAPDSAVPDSFTPDSSAAAPASILMVGVNGTGKTTTAGKLARLLVAENRSVLLGAADTFRAAAADQLETWGERVGVPVVRSEKEGADPASVAFEAVKVAAESDIDVVIVDTAGRLQNKAGLMDELGKIKRVMEKQAPVREVLLVLDATTGQNGMQQAKVFADVTGLTGIVLTKLDGTAKGGIVISVQREIGVPVKFVGLGEGADDLAPFDPEGFVDSLLG